MAKDRNDPLQRPEGIAIIGRPNVGKSSLFNAIVGRKMAIVHEESGVTRDRVIARVSRYGKNIQVIDTGGLVPCSRRQAGPGDPFLPEINEQVEIAIREAETLFLVTDVQAGVIPPDRQIADLARRHRKNIFVVVNKCDNDALEAQAVDFAELGFEQVFPVSCLHRRGISSLLRAAVNGLSSPPMVDADPFRLAVVGRPNVGKSSFINKFLGEERLIVSPMAGTTRDAVNIEFTLNLADGALPAVLVDTAGLRKRSKLDGAVEKFSVIRARKAIEHAGIILFMVEAAGAGITAQDRRIGQLIAASGKACVLLANKWDLCRNVKANQVKREIRRQLPFLQYAPLILTCAVSGYNFSEITRTIGAIKAQMALKIPTAILNRVVQEAGKYNAPPLTGRKALKIYYATMTGNPPPSFTLFVNDYKLCPPDYRRYLRNFLQNRFGFAGLPVTVKLRNRPQPRG